MNQKFTLRASAPCSESKTANAFVFCHQIVVRLLFLILFLSYSTNSFADPATFPTKTFHQFSQKVQINWRNSVPESTSAIESSQMLAAVCPGGSGVIGGKVFQDFNYNGLDDQVGAGIEGIEVTIFGCAADGSSETVQAITTDLDGTYFFSGLTDGVDYRVEFSIPADKSYLQSGFNGADSRTTVQFVQSPSCEVDLGLANPADFCEADPSLAIPCYVNGDPLAANSGSADEEAFVVFKTSFEGRNPKPTVLAIAEEIGATWGVAYHKETQTIFTSAFLKRHVGLGPLGLGGIYSIDISGAQPVVNQYIDVNDIGINVGDFLSNSARGLSANVNLPNNDTQAFTSVGKQGIGGLCMSEDGSKLYLVNLTENKLHSINLGNGQPTASDVRSFTLPNPGCTGGSFRPFGVKMNNGKVYVGGVCDAETSQSKANLSAIVYRLDGNSFTEVLNFSLDYTKGLASRNCADGGWFPWITEVPESCINVGSSLGIVYPTPQLSALEFDAAGNMILGFTDRTGNQFGFINFGPTGTTQTYSNFTGGDLLKAGRNSDGSFTIENNGTAGANTTAGAGNGEGPGGGEFYYQDLYSQGPNIPIPHRETGQGGLALIKGSGQIITTALDPIGTSVNAGGVNYFNNQTGEGRDPGYRVFQSSASSPASFSKANGLGDLVALCGLAPIEIGGRLWVDANKNGVQDPCESPFSGVQVALYNMQGDVTEVVESDANGEYYFNGSGENIPAITPNTDYYVVFGFGDQFDNFNNILLDSFFLTTVNNGMGNNPDLNDSDAMTTMAGVLGGAFEGWPSIQVTTGNVGEVTHDNDAGFFVDVPAITENISGFVWNDLNENGLQNAGEPGIVGVNVSLFASNNTFIVSTATDSEGNYLFENVEGRNYYLVFDASNDPTVGDNFTVTLQDVGSDESVDSDISPSDARVDFEFEPVNGPVEFDAGYTLPVAQVVGFVFNDLDQDGQQGNNDPGIGGVTVTLFNSSDVEVGTATTDANGNYVFDNVMAGDYYVVVNVATNTDGISNFEGTQQDVGDDEFDSDVNPSTGQSDVFTHNPLVGNSDIDAGYFEPTADILGFVWNDANENGLQNEGESGIAGVRVNLLNGNGLGIAFTTTDANGNYNFTDVKSDDYSLTFDASNDPNVGNNFDVTLQDVGSDENIDSDIRQSDQTVEFTFDAGSGSAEYDAGYTLPLANIMGLAFDDVNRDGLQGNNEPMIGGVTVTLFSGNGTAIENTTTDDNGNYAFDEIMGGDYYIVFDVSTNTASIDNYLGTIQDAGDDDFDSDASPDNGRTDTFTFNPIDGDRNFDAGYFVGTGTITGSVFNDLNENGLQDAGEPGIGGVKVTVIASDGIPINTNTSNSDGSFSVGGIPEGTVTVLFDPDDNSDGLENLTPTIKDVNNNQNDDIDSDINPNKEADPFNFVISVGADVDAGFFEPVDPVMIGDFVFKDCNENGVQDEGEVGIPNVPITLRGSNDLGTPVVMEMTTNSMGKYLFTVSRPGTYTLDFDIPEGVTGLAFSPKNRGAGNLDSDVNPLSGATDAITLTSGMSNLNIDAGVIDNSPPLIFNVPPDVTVDCNDIPNPPSTVKGVDNCDPYIDVIFSERILNEGSCPYIIERTWTAVDDCGNSAIRTQRVTVTDTQAPVITIANPLIAGLQDGGEVIFECDNMPEFSAADVNATDDCSEVEVKFVDLVREQGDCAEDGFIVKMTCAWIAEDDCGNRSEFNIVIFVVDTKSPTLNNIPEDVTVNLDQGQFIPPVANTVTATDNCDEYVRVEFEETQTAGVCGYELVRTWTGYDDCGNKTVESQKLTLLEDCTCPDSLVSKTLVWDAACDGSVGGMISLDLTADINKYDITISPNTGSTNFVGNMFNDLPPGDYTVTVNYDALEPCSETYNFTVKTATPSTIEVVKQTQADCFTANGTVTLSPPNFTYTWSDGGTGAQRSNLAAGEYIVSFTDANNCQGAQAINITNPENCECIDFKANLLWEIMPTCNGFTNGQVDIEIIGGTAPYTYLWHDGQTTKDLFSAMGGPYSVTVTDANDCTATLSGTLGQPEPISIQETLMNGKCGEKGAIDIFVSGGTAPYTYNWSNGATTEDLTNLPTGSYTVTVKDANDCENSLTIDISNSGNIAIELASTNPTCATESNGSVTATVSGGQNPLSYQWSNGATTSSITNVPAGTYAVMVTDATGCSATEEVTLEAPNQLMVNLVPSSPECGAIVGNITLSVDGGTTPYAYQWSNGATTKDLVGVAAGTYEVLVTDANGCSIRNSAMVEIYSAITIDVTTQAPACDGEAGEITLTVNGGTPTYSYIWSNGATTKDLTNIAPGNYRVTVTDANGCSMTASANVGSAAGLVISNSVTNPSCAGEASGSITVTISGGVAPYTYAWTNGATTKDINNLMPGGYTLTATDANGCTITTTAVIEAPANLFVVATPTNPVCFGATGSIDVTVSGGTGNYTYMWDFGATTEDVEGLLTGNYTVTVTDANGCSATATASIVVPMAITGTANAAAPDCSGGGGQIDLTVQGGTAPYTFKWSNDATTEDLTDVLPGSYTIEITDAKGCSTVISAEVTSTAGLSITPMVTASDCAGVADGAIDLTVTGGTPPFSYNWTNGATTKDVSGLMPGAYSVVVTDANGCELMETFTIDAPTAISIEAEVDNPDCFGGTGKINITVAGGMAPYTFTWSNGATTEDLNDIPAGTYMGTVTDANGCTATASATLTAPAALSATTSITNQDCSGDGTIDLTVTGGTAPYNYLWSNGATTEDLPKVGGGTYTVVISDANDCKLTEVVTVESTGGIEIFVSGTQPTCPNSSDGSLSLEVKGGTMPYSYAWSNGSAAAGLVNIPAGEYSVTVTDAKGCTLVGPAVLNPAPEIMASATAINPICSGGLGSIEVKASGGTGNLTYAWSNGATTKDIHSLMAGAYTATITDANGCSITVSENIITPSDLTVTATPSNLGCDGTTGNIAVDVTGGTGPYTYVWSNNSFEANLNNVAAGAYSLTVVDANGCSKTASATIELIDNITIQIDGTANPTCVDGADGFINLTVSGGVAPYTYDWTNGATTEDISGLTAGFYAVTVTDARGCKVVIDALLENPESMDLTVVATNPNCPRETGSIDLTVMGGTAPYRYIWNNGATTQDLSNVPAGNYQVNVTDANGCSMLSENVSVVAPNDFTISLNPKSVRCYAETNGEILLTNTGSGNYTYAWSNGATTQNLANLPAGTYGVTVTNEKGCTKTAETVINTPPAISLSMTFSDPQCPNDLGSINIEVDGGTKPYSYAWSNGATTEDIADIPAGRYTVSVTDANGCTLEGSATIRPASEIVATIETTNITCATVNGSIDLNVSGGSGTYSYLWNTGATSQDLSNLGVGTYEVLITDTKGCRITAKATIVDECACPSPLINQNMVTNARCGEANGSIMIMVNGDMDFYSFEWSPNLGTKGANNNERTDLPSGTYDVKVSFANRPLCTETVRLVVGNKDGESGSVSSVKPADCGEENGQVILTPGVSYIWPDGSQSQNRTNLAPGTYTIKTIDGSGCESSLTVTVGEASCAEVCTLDANIGSAVAPDCEGNLGSIDLVVTGGTAPFTYEWSDPTIGNIKNPTGLTEGTYSVMVMDAKRCMLTLHITLTKPDCDVPVTSPCNVMLFLESTDLTCDGDDDGTIKVDVMNGQAPYVYEWSNGATTDKIENLAAGEYTIEVTDANGCKAYGKIVVRTPGPLVVTETRTVIDCESVEIKLNVTGGRGPYQWVCENRVGTTLDALNLTPGTYECVVSDASFCSVNHTLVVEEYVPLSVTGVVKNTTCGQEDGSIDLTPTGGTAPYTFTWDCGLYGDEDQFNLGPHSYNVTVTDATNCTTTANYTVQDCSGESFAFVAVEAVSLGNKEVQLTWATRNETMSGNYLVLHSLDGENYDVLGTAMEGKGPVASANYEMTEQANFGKNYYKVKYLNEMEETYFSEVAEVVVFLDGSSGRLGIPAIVYPNPSYDEFTLDFARPIDAEISVMITDMDGVVLESVKLEPGTPKRVFQVGHYQSGVYNITLQQRRKKLKSYRLIRAQK
ncbi:MAG: SdrD B-like domain-containing protein [Bacteroidota bacterium]